MSLRFNFNKKTPADLLLDRACGLKRSLSMSASMDLSELERADVKRIIADATQILCDDLAKEPGTIPLNGQSLAKVFLALAYSKVTWSRMDNFLKLALRECICIHNCFETMTAKDIANILWSLARMGCRKQQTPGDYGLDFETQDLLIQALSQSTAMPDFNVLTCTNILWSCVVLDFNFAEIACILPSILEVILNKMEQDDGLFAFNVNRINQIRDFIAYYHDQFPKEWEKDLLRLTLYLDQRTKQRTAPQSSASHKQVECFIREHCTLPFLSEVPIAGGFADICFPDEKVVIEFYGPLHYDENGELNSRSSFRQRMMQKCGFRVFEIDYRDWQSIPNKHEYIRGLLRAANLPLREVAPRSLPAPRPSLTIFLPERDTHVVITGQAPVVFFATDPSVGSKRSRRLAGLADEEREPKRLRMDQSVDDTPPPSP